MTAARAQDRSHSNCPAPSSSGVGRLRQALRLERRFIPWTTVMLNSFSIHLRSRGWVRQRIETEDFFACPSAVPEPEWTLNQVQGDGFERVQPS